MAESDEIVAAVAEALEGRPPSVYVLMFQTEDTDLLFVVARTFRAAVQQANKWLPEYTGWDTISDHTSAAVEDVVVFDEEPSAWKRGAEADGGDENWIAQNVGAMGITVVIQRHDLMLESP